MRSIACAAMMKEYVFELFVESHSIVQVCENLPLITAQGVSGMSWAAEAQFCVGSIFSAYLLPLATSEDPDISFSQMAF